MALYKKRYTFTKIDQDLAPDKRDSTTHLNIVNFEVFLTSRGASLQTAKGTKAFDTPLNTIAPYNDPLTDVFVIGHGGIDDDLYIFTTNNTGQPNETSEDAIYQVIANDTQLTIVLIKDSNWQFSTQNPISAWGIRESATSEKLYWVDGYNQARFTNVLAPNDLNIDYVLSNPSPSLITAVPYGVTASTDAIVRYGYTLYNIGGSESKLSPLTSPVDISTEGDSARINLSGFTSTYDAWRIYRVKYESYQGEPTFDVIAEGLVPTDINYIELVDGGNLFVNSISVEEFVDIGSDLFVPHAIAPKKQRLFFGNYTIEPFEVEEDMRAFGHGGGTLGLDPATAIPADLNLVYQPYTSTGVPLKGVLTQTINGTRLTGDLLEGEYEEFTILGPQFYVQATALSDNLRLEVYDLADGPDPDFGDMLTWQLVIGGKGVGDPGPIINISGKADNYLVRMTPDKPKLQSSTVQIDYSEDITNTIDFTVSHNTVPDTDGWVYSGVTGVLDTSRVRISPVSNGGDYLTDWFADGVDSVTLSATVSGQTTIMSLVIEGDILTNGRVFQYYETPYIFLEADLTGTRQLIISTGAGIKLRTSAQAEGDGLYYSNYNLVDTNIDAINSDYDVYKYQAIGSTLGAEGAFTKFTWVHVPGGTTDHKDRVFKSGEIYRIGIVLYDQYGRYSQAYWCCDLKVPYTTSGNVDGHRDYYRLDGMLKLQPTGVRGFKFVMVKRTLGDMSVVTQGMVQPVMNYKVGGEDIGLYPFPTAKEVKGNGAGVGGESFFDVRVGNNPTTEQDFPINGSPWSTTEIHTKSSNLVYTPETFLAKTALPVNRIRIVGLQELNTAKDATRMEFYNPDDNKDEAKTFDSMKFDMKAELDPGYNIIPRCLLGDFYDEGQDDSYAVWLYYRAGGVFHSSSQSADPQDKQEEIVDTCKYLAIDSVVTSGSYVISNTIDQPKFAGETGLQICNYQAEHADCYALDMQSATWSGATANYGDFLSNTTLGTSVNDRAWPIVDLVQSLTEQYGGGSKEAKSRNTYIDASRGATDTEIGTNIQMFGDVYNGVYYLAKTTSSRKVTDANQCSVFDYIKVGLESKVNMAAANKVIRDIDGNFDGAISSNLKALEVKNLLEYDTVHSTIPDAVLTQAKPFNYVPITQYINRITVSTTKVAGEVVDSWTKINLGTYMDLESQFGSITALVRAKDRVFAFQNRGIAFISIYPDKQTQTESGAIQLARGSVLDNYVYVSENSGTENKQAIAVHEDSVFFVDTVNRTLNSLKEGEVSTLKGFNSIVSTLTRDTARDYLGPGNPGGAFVFINNKLKQVMFKFADPLAFPILAYNYVTGAFTNSRTYYADYYMTFNNGVISAANSQLFKHDEGAVGSYHEETESAQLHMYIEPFPGVDKVFDAVQVMKQGNLNFDKIKVDSSTRTSGSTTIDFSFDSKYDIHTAYLPRVEASMDRWRERNIKLLLEYNGTEPLEIDEVFVKFSVKK